MYNKYFLFEKSLLNKVTQRRSLMMVTQNIWGSLEVRHLSTLATLLLITKEISTVYGTNDLSA